MASRTAATGIVPAGRRLHDLLELLDRLNPTIAELSQPIEQEAEVRGGATTDDASGCGCADRTGFRSWRNGFPIQGRQRSFIVIIADTELAQCCRSRGPSVYFAT
jgi:hypothetical protein